MISSRRLSPVSLIIHKQWRFLSIREVSHNHSLKCIARHRCARKKAKRFTPGTILKPGEMLRINSQEASITSLNISRQMSVSRNEKCVGEKSFIPELVSKEDGNGVKENKFHHSRLDNLMNVAEDLANPVPSITSMSSTTDNDSNLLSDRSRKEELMTYFQNAAWDDVDRVLELLDKKYTKRSRNSLRLRVSRKYHRASLDLKKVQNSMRQQRLERRREKNSNVIEKDSNFEVSLAKKENPMDNNSIIDVDRDSIPRPREDVALDGGYTDEVKEGGNDKFNKYNQYDERGSLYLEPSGRLSQMKPSLIDLLNENYEVENQGNQQNQEVSESNISSNIFEQGRSSTERVVDDDLNFLNSTNQGQSQDAFNVESRQPIDILNDNKVTNNTVINQTGNNEDALSLLDIISDDLEGSNKAIKNFSKPATGSSDSIDSVNDNKKSGNKCDSSSVDKSVEKTFERSSNENLDDYLQNGTMGNIEEDNSRFHSIENDESQTNLLPSLHDVLLKLKAFHSEMSDSDWDLYSDLRKGSHDVETQLNMEENNNEGRESGPYEFDHCIEQVKELIDGSNTNRWVLTSDEYNLLLHYVAMSKSQAKSELLLNIYLRMRELEKAGIELSAPNSDTYSILMLVFHKGANAPAIASKLCSLMLTRINDATLNDIKKFTLEEDTVYIGMKVLEKKFDVRSAETLLELALSQSGEGVHVTPSVFESLLNLYKAEDQRDKALQLIDQCIQESIHCNNGVLEKFLISAVNWPHKRRDGSRIPISAYCKSLIELLEFRRDSFCPSVRVWRRLMITSSRAAKFEALENWSLVHRCCVPLIYDKFHGFLDNVVLEIALKAAEIVKDPQFAVDILSRANSVSSIERSQDPSRGDSDDKDPFIWHPDTENDNSESFRFQHLPPSVYFDAINLCLNCRNSELAYQLLILCSKNEGIFPIKTLSELYTVVLIGCAKEGDLERTEKIFSEMRSKQLKCSEQSYSAYLHVLAVNNKHEQALTLLDSMISNAYNDGIKPGLASFSACMLSAMQIGAWEDVLRLNEKMIQYGIQPSATSLHGVVIANSKLGNYSGALHAMESAIKSEIPIDRNSFMACARILITTGIFDDNDDSDFEYRQKLREIADNASNNNIAKKSLALNRSLSIALAEDKRQPSKMKSIVALQDQRDRLWREALADAIQLGKYL